MRRRRVSPSLPVRLRCVEGLDQLIERQRAFFLRARRHLGGLRVLAVLDGSPRVGVAAEGIGERHVRIAAEGEEAGPLIGLGVIGHGEGLAAGGADPDHQAAMLAVAVAIVLAGRLERADEAVGEFGLHSWSLSLLAKFLAKQRAT